MSVVISALRDATKRAHAALEADLDPEALCSSRDRYAKFVGALHGFHEAADARLDGFVLPGLAPGPARTQLLAQDLRALGADPSALPVMPGLPEIDDDGARHGLLYVIEGSALGGIVLAKLVDRHLGIGPTDGAAFFSSGAATPGRWRLVKGALEREAQGARLGPAQRPATGTFDALGEWMRARVLVPGSGGDRRP